VAGKDRSGEIDAEGAVTKPGAFTLALTALADGESARIVGLSGSRSTMGKLEAMGIAVGAVIEKKSSALRRGPVVVGKGTSQLALAYAIAERILVEPLRRREGR
jgi:Fe2+ transport system protein FeoA